MGQRSQIYCLFEQVDKDDKKVLLARYYQWNYGEFMISRIRHFVEYIKNTANDYVGRNMFHYWYTDRGNIHKMVRILDTNFDIESVVISHDILEEYNYYGRKGSFKDYVFEQDNNDGACFLYVKNDGTIKCLFTDTSFIDRLTPYEYLKDYTINNDKEVCLDNCKYITENTEMMTNEEWEELFFNNDLSSLVERATTVQINEFRLSMAWNKLLSSKKKFEGREVGEILASFSDEEATRCVKKYAQCYEAVKGMTERKTGKPYNAEKYILDILEEIKNEKD